MQIFHFLLNNAVKYALITSEATHTPQVNCIIFSQRNQLHQFWVLFFRISSCAVCMFLQITTFCIYHPIKRSNILIF